MKTYADTSFIVRLVSEEADSEEAISEYRSLGRPALFYLGLHALEVTNALRQRAFYARRTEPSGMRQIMRRQAGAALDRISRMLRTGALLDCTIDIEDALNVARALSERHTERLGCRSFDVLHVAAALKLKTELFLTADRIQASLARAEGLSVRGAGEAPA